MGKIRPNGLSKIERLYLNREVEALFASRQSFSAFPFRVVIHTEKAQESSDGSAVKILVSIPKKRLKHAVDRNTMKRHVRESYRTNKSEIVAATQEQGLQVSIGFLYLANELMPGDKVLRSVRYALGKIVSLLSEAES
ncbi:ribonuclease P protein component [Porphyromonas sp.]|uniref:ribonuclease P protein component n=1 Tax=Porphyromonas sp. TaxID=1924944 RepID=UPI0026DBC131|nr:ribonuclease P protein component [Porphyromonas sp.]MDO4695802.1 ribonuclease P protein component [Porphyromonas sp.]MDO4771792.1 ribonuclease P protein component [Porphyromonas sp.]